MRVWIWICSAYALVLAASFVYRAFQPAEPLPAGYAAVQVAEYDGDTRTGRTLHLAYRDLGRPDGPPVVLLHGSPGSLQDFAALGRALAPSYRVLVPDLPGFGASDRDLADHSFATARHYVYQLLDTLDIGSAHWIAFSWGGGVAISAADDAPERVRSLVLVAAIGVQELELLGNYELNRLIHGLQFAFVRALDFVIPRFSNRSGASFVSSFLDSDQRPMRGALERWRGPTFIVHGENDFLVPIAAAREHHRIVAQSEALWLDAGHLVLWRQPAVVARALGAWLERVEQNAVVRRNTATPIRVAAAARPFDPMDAGPQNGLGWLVFFGLVFFASLVSEDLTCAGVGLLVANVHVSFFGGALACLVGLVLGDLLLYSGGRLAAPLLLRRVRRADTDGIAARLRERGAAAILASRFVPGARLPTYVLAGAVRYPAWRFSLLLVLAAAIWTPVIVGIAATAGTAARAWMPTTSALAWGAVLGLTAVYSATRLVPRLCTWRGRRLLLARYLRLRRWEFWPVWVLYTPIVPYIVWQALRRRSLRVVALANPGIPGGGLAGESKYAIQQMLDRVPDHALATALSPAGDPTARSAAARRFMLERGLVFPVVLKPDIGERGTGVAVVRSTAEIEAYFAKNPPDTLVQEYAGGLEYGLFYAREAGNPAGRLLSVAEKRPRRVTGDGQRTMAQLILGDREVLPAAPALLRQNTTRLGIVPGAGEVVVLGELGTHSRGCQFLDANELWTAELEDAVDTLSRALDGVCFGRYDVRSASVAALQRGEFAVLELNGLTGEAAHMYDAKYGLGDALRVLRWQWRMAFEIGAGHRARGDSLPAWREMVTLIRRRRIAAR